jgi:hypothetical protein
MYRRINCVLDLLQVYQQQYQREYGQHQTRIHLQITRKIDVFVGDVTVS